MSSIAALALLAFGFFVLGANAGAWVIGRRIRRTAEMAEDAHASAIRDGAEHRRMLALGMLGAIAYIRGDVK